jgi:hypothetical protein
LTRIATAATGIAFHSRVGLRAWAIFTRTDGAHGVEICLSAADIPNTTFARTSMLLMFESCNERPRWRPGLCFIKEWFRNGAPAGEVSISTQPDAVILVHRACPPGATESRIVELQVPIIWTKCHLGGRRPWFKCLTTINGEVCGRRVAKLYGPCFACRRCLGLGYESQREIPLRRAGRRAQKIKMRLGGSNDPLEPFPQKPRRMHWRTYRRLRDQANAAKAEADYLLAESMLGQFLDLVPPRRKRQRGRRDGGPKPPPAAGSPLTPSRPHRPDRP